ncbi:hypothetical protein [Halobacillus alkaliphilus]|uniref:hypothetical protein n=1 Tax=Halobacillus alkaliphilus TaxID=396056 RepID=UPI003CCC3ADB
MGYRLESQNTFIQQIDLGSFSLSSGRYRVVKTFHAAHTEISIQLAVELEVEQSDMNSSCSRILSKKA